MKRAAMLVAVLALAVFLAAQSQPQSPAQTIRQQAGTPLSTGKPPVQTKTKEEYQAYQAAIANAQNPEALEKAADDFAAKFPESDVRLLLYRAAMSSYQSAGNSQKMLDVGLKILKLDKDDPDALIGVAEVLEERTTPTDLDREERAAQAVGYAQHALETIDTDLSVPSGTPPEKIESYKKYLRSTALAIVGTIEYKQEHYLEAETHLRKAIEADAANPDAVIVLRLALALHQEKKYTDALEQANRAVELTQDNTDIGKMARDERDRLIVQTKASAPPAPAPETSAPPSH